MPESLRAFALAADLPVRLEVVDTASQPVPRRRVLDAARDPVPDAPYVMSHPAFVLGWADGRRLVVDAGMDRAGALAFGRPLEWLGAGPIVPHASLAERVAPHLDAGPLGLVPTHLHTDHVGGVLAWCAALPAGARVRLFQTAAQAERTNHTTRPGRALLDTAGCLDPVRLDAAPAAPVPGFPGTFVIHAAGHTPGSQIVGAWLREGGEPRGVLFVGDVANVVDGIRLDLPKPWAYRTFVVPENEPRLARVRAFLREAADRAGFLILPSHDRLHLVASGLLAPAP